MKKIVFIVIGICIIIVCFFVAADHLFHSSFVKQAETVRVEAGRQDNRIVTEDDLQNLPDPVKRYMRYSGIVGETRISSMRLVHSGSFKPGSDKQFMSIAGEYSLTTKKPSFCWYGKISLVPGITVTASDSYFKGHGKMIVKVMSVFTIVDSPSKELDLSAFGRCMAEMTLTPSFFLDSERVHWLRSDSTSAECLVNDSGLSTTAWLYFRTDGSMEKIVVERYYDRNNGQSTLEKFIGVGSDIRDYHGLKLASTIDGYWNLKEGNVHYVHFVVENVEYE